MSNKFSTALSDILLKFSNLQADMAALSLSIKKLKQINTNMLKKEQKAALIQKKPRKPCGFALPVPVSDVLCDFLNIPHGSHVARTHVTKQINLYIKENNLLSPTNKKHIIPDKTLSTILHEYDASLNTPLTHFNLQKFINFHFKPIANHA